jgi:transposase
VKRYRPYSPEQAFLLPPSPQEWLAEGHLAYFVLDLVTELDLGEIELVLQSKDARGERPYSPRMMVAMLLYGYATGVISSRKLERATYDDVAFRVLAAGEHPHFTSINEFRDRHRHALAGLFDQLLQECMSAGLVKLGHVAIDGTKMKANASKHKAMSAERMDQAETRLTSEIDAYFELAKKIDADEDARYGAGEQAHDLPAELRRREDRLAKIREVRAALKKETESARAEEHVQQADQLRTVAARSTTSVKKQGEFATLAALHDQHAGELIDKHDDDEPPPPSADDDLPRNTPPKRPDGSPKPTAQRNFTDADSRIMMRDGAFLQAYNGQIAVDESPHQIIVAAGLSNQAPDAEYFRPVLERVVENCGVAPDRVTADSGYFSAANVRAAEHLGAEPFISVGKHRNDGELDVAVIANRTTPERLAMADVLATERGRAVYARRKATVEPVFGQIRICQNYQHVSFRGLLKNRLEWLFVCATHNLRKLWRATRRSALLVAG